MYPHIDPHCETIKVVQQCNMEERLQPRPIFVSERIANMCGKSVNEPIPHT